jgi:CheY-like chemotaxis protein
LIGDDTVLVELCQFARSVTVRLQLSTAQQASVAVQENPDLVLLDVMMPGWAGGSL